MKITETQKRILGLSAIIAIAVTFFTQNILAKAFPEDIINLSFLNKFLLIWALAIVLAYAGLWISEKWIPNTKKTIQGLWITLLSSLVLIWLSAQTTAFAFGGKFGVFSILSLVKGGWLGIIFGGLALLAMIGGPAGIVIAIVAILAIAGLGLSITLPIGKAIGGLISNPWIMIAVVIGFVLIFTKGRSGGKTYTIKT